MDETSFTEMGRQIYQGPKVKGVTLTAVPMSPVEATAVTPKVKGVTLTMSPVVTTTDIQKQPMEVTIPIDMLKLPMAVVTMAAPQPMVTYQTLLPSPRVEAATPRLRGACQPVKGQGRQIGK